MVSLYRSIRDRSQEAARLRQVQRDLARGEIRRARGTQRDLYPYA